MNKKLQRFVGLIHTVRHLKLKQIYYRIYYRFRNLSVIEPSQPVQFKWKWTGPLLNKQSLFSHNKVRFLNQDGLVNSINDWNCSNKAKLWLYNLHYFDDLSSCEGPEREALQSMFIAKWIEENPPCAGNGWEPYPTSLRLVNWVKWCSLQHDVSSSILKSMLQQGLILNQQLEYHILGNHLFANAKALTFVGAYLKGDESERLLDKGIQLINSELSEQFLADGGHFELSPMYHEILLWDLLELIDLAYTSQNKILLECLSYWKEIAQAALSWLSSMIHPDGEVSFFNDSAIGIAMKPDQIFSYASKLGIEFDTCTDYLITHNDSGYSRVSFLSYSLIFDHANVGPDYLPGHAHADTLSFEMSIGEQRVFVNSGTSLYGLSEERLRQRKTPAHNTISVDSYDSSQVWSGFRVAKRAYAKLEKAICDNNEVVISASHNGYLQQKPKVKHTRTLSCDSHSLVIVDSMSKPIESCFHLHLHPDVLLKKTNEKSVEVFLADHILCTLSSSEAITIMDSTYHPEFGKSIPNKKIQIPFSNGNLKTQINFISESM